jgi:hypothetical protein
MVGPQVPDIVVRQGPGRPPIPRLYGFRLPQQVVNALAQGGLTSPTPTILLPSTARAATPSHPTPTITQREADRVEARADELGKNIRLQCQALVDVGWDIMIQQARGRGDLQARPPSHHGAAPLLQRMAKHGVPAVMTTAPWSLPTLKQRAKRGPHKSCEDHLDFLRGEILEFVEKGYWIVLPLRILLLLQAQGAITDLRLSPMGVVPQRERRPRVIVDYSYYQVNQETIQLAPQESMQFGRALERVLYNVRHAHPRYGPVYLGKIDLADGFYRVGLNPSATAKLGVCFPKYSGEEQMVALPLVLPMGWVESVPYFCAATETAADLANNPTNPHEALPPHLLEAAANTPPPPELTPAPPPGLDTATPVLRPYQKPLRQHDIYLDDYIMQVQGSKRQQQGHLRRLLHSIDAVFRPLEPGDPPLRQHVPSVKKLSKGDAYWSTRKVILGWIIDTARGTLELPIHRRERLSELFLYLKGRTRVDKANLYSGCRYEDQTFQETSCNPKYYRYL